MNRLFAIICILVVVSSLAGLYVINSGIQLFEDRSDYEPKDIVTANNEFAVNFFKTIYNDPKYKDKNIFFSPTNMIVAFSMLYEGARGDTATQMEDLFGFDPNTQNRHKIIAELMSSLKSKDHNTTLTLANALWIPKWYEVYEPYANTMRQIYLADVENVNFGDPNDGITKINNWADNKTNGMIKQIIDPNDVNYFMPAILNNVAYFNGTWLTPFSEDDTTKKIFLSGTNEIEIDFMNIFSHNFNYIRAELFTGLRLPYDDNRFSMLIILPRYEGLNFDYVLTATLIKELQDGLYEIPVGVSIPKFEIQTNYSVDSLSNMGMSDIFDERKSNLSGIKDISKLPRNFYIASATQDAYIKIDEGIQASEDSAMSIVSNEGYPHENFVANFPFIFLIQDDQSGAILFMGMIVDPTLG